MTKNVHKIKILIGILLLFMHYSDALIQAPSRMMTTLSV